MKFNKILMTFTALALTAGAAHATALTDVTTNNVSVVSDFGHKAAHQETAQLTYYVKSAYTPPAVTLEAKNDVDTAAADNTALGSVVITPTSGQQVCYASSTLAQYTKVVVAGGTAALPTSGSQATDNTCAAANEKLTIALLKDGTSTMDGGSHTNTIQYNVYTN